MAAAAWIDILSFLNNKNPSVIKPFGFDAFDEDESYILCKYNRNSFPKEGFWVSDKGVKWFKTGLSTFAVRIKDGVGNRDTFPVQEETVVITRTIKKLATISITCNVNEARKKTIEELDDDESPYGHSVVCGTVVLSPKDIEITMLN